MRETVSNDAAGSHIPFLETSNQVHVMQEIWMTDSQSFLHEARERDAQRHRQSIGFANLICDECQAKL